MADDSDISSDSDEEFLTVSDDRKGHLDREAIVVRIDDISNTY